MRRATEAEVFQDRPDDNGSIELGTVGWDDGSDHYDIEASGLTLVKVTLFRGAVAPAEGETPDPTRARGRQILCRLSAPLWTIPDDGAQVTVAIPAGFGSTPGAPMILGWHKDTPAQQFGTNSGKDAVLDFGPDRRLIIKAGTVVLSDYENRYLVLSPETGVKVGDPDASGFCLKSGKWMVYSALAADAKVIFEMDAAGGGVRIADKSGGSPAGLEIKAGSWIGYGTTFNAMAAMVLLGKAPEASKPAVYMNSGSPAASLGVFISPV